MCDKELEEIIDKIKKYAPNADTEVVVKAYNLAKKAHEGQFRRSGEPYFIHPIAVAKILISMELDMQTIAAGLLHDVIEDTDYGYDYIKEAFGKEIADLVDGVTKLGQIKYQSKEATQAENLRKMFLAMAKDIRVILIKLADRLHNMRTLKYMPEEKAKPKAIESLEIYGGLANRLGISMIKWELEDLALRYIDKDGYYDLVSKVSSKRSEREESVKNIVALLEETFEDVDIKCEVYGRPKHFYSIYNKMNNKNKNFDQIFDLMAVRVLVDSVKDCYAVLGMVHTLWKPIPGRFKDYIAMPKPNMYQSLHTTVIGPGGEPVEIQIRTQEMHRIAEYGIAAHWKYKEGKSENVKLENKETNIDEKLHWLKQMIEWEKDLKDPQEFMNALKDDLFNSQVYVFTPQGDVIELPAGSTPIDFAYRVHTNIGNKCTGAKIDGRIVNLNYELKTGNIVEILTSSNSNGPNRDWINIAKTPNAKSKIRQWLKKERRDENIERGKSIIEKETKKHSIIANDATIEKYLIQIAKRFNQPTIEDLYATLGYGGITTYQIMPRLKELYEKDNVKKVEKKEIKDHSMTTQEYNKQRKPSKTQGVVLKGVDNILVRYAKCCNPLPGDEIVGYITKGRGVAVHRTDCPNTTGDNDEFKKRMIDVYWNIEKPTKFEAEIQIKALDKRGIINEITHIVASEKISLNGIYARKTKDIGVNINLLVEVDSIEELNLLMKKLKNVSGVHDIFRVTN